MAATAADAKPTATSAEAHFWQALLAADLSAAQRATFLDSLYPGVDRLSALRSWAGLSHKQRERLSRVPIERVDRALELGIQVLAGNNLPSSFEGIDHLPPALFAWGDPSVLEAPCISIVGTRTASSYGLACSYKFAQVLAKAGATIISGGAFGIDTEAHKGALAAGGKTAAVFGTGVDKVYPSSNSELYKSIRSSGVLLSPFAIGTPSMEYNFLRRNPVVAALGQALLVIEAPLRSGSLSTATAALEFGREVFVVPGPVTLISFRGSHQLVREGATLVDHPDMLVEILGLESKTDSAAAPLDPQSEKILACLDAEPKTTESICLESGLEISDAMTTLTLLEIDGLVTRRGTGYIRA